MSDHATPFEELMASAPDSAATNFTTAFRGYDKDEVDSAVATLSNRLNAQAQQIAELQDAQFRADRSQTDSADVIARLEADVAEARAQAEEAQARVDDEVAAATSEERDAVERLKAELLAANAKLEDAENRAETLTEELMGTTGDSPSRHKFEEVLRVAEEQAGVLLRNATSQGERLLTAANEEIQARRKDSQADAEAIVSQAQHDAQQIRLKIDTELTAHQARVEREANHADEKISQAEQEAAAIRSEAEKGAAALRSMVARETSQQRAEAEEAVRELRVRAIEFEESLSRRQDDAQQEFLMLHNQAVAHAERITQDANDQVANSLEHAQRVGARADDFERLMRAQAHEIEADANLRSREKLDRARDKSERIIEMVTTHSQAILRDAEDRTRQLRWQQQQLTSFMAEVKALIREEVPVDETADADAETPVAEKPAPKKSGGKKADDTAATDEQPSE
ncbi:MAG: cell division initiation protein [Microbacteriaceae bacterium]